jgi:hypothetical protein
MVSGNLTSKASRIMRTNPSYLSQALAAVISNNFDHPPLQQSEAEVPTSEEVPAIGYESMNRSREEPSIHSQQLKANIA